MAESDTAPGVAQGTVGWLVPALLNGRALTEAIAACHTLGSAGTTTVVVRKRRGITDVDMLSTGITLDYTQYYVADGTIASDTKEDIATGDIIYVDVDGVSDCTGLSVTMVFS